MTRNSSKSSDGHAAHGIDRWTDRQRLSLLACYDVWSATPTRSCFIADGATRAPLSPLCTPPCQTLISI